MKDYICEKFFVAFYFHDLSLSHCLSRPVIRVTYLIMGRKLVRWHFK